MPKKTKAVKPWTLASLAPLTVSSPRGDFDEMIGRLDRMLSEFLLAAASLRDEADRQTIKHHAEDLIGVGNKALALLETP